MAEQTTPSSRHHANVIHFEQIDVIFKGRKNTPVKVLDQLSFSVREGEVFCLLGPNGSGKTTTINVLIGLLKPANGTVRVLDLDPGRARAQILRALALVPQETALYNNLTARENLLFHGRYYGIAETILQQRIDSMLELVRLKGRQYDRVKTFSGGMQRRLSMARALLSDPQILLLDEPTLGVDVQSRQAIWDQIHHFAAEGKTIFLTTNYMEEAEALADRLLIIDRGQVVTTGTPEALKAQVQQKQLVLRFQDQLHADAVYSHISTQHVATMDDTKILFQMGRVDDVLQLLQTLPDALGQHSERLVGLELKDPTLQDVFLHFTGRELRD